MITRKQFLAIIAAPFVALNVLTEESKPGKIIRLEGGREHLLIIEPDMESFKKYSVSYDQCYWVDKEISVKLDEVLLNFELGLYNPKIN